MVVHGSMSDVVEQEYPSKRGVFGAISYRSIGWAVAALDYFLISSAAVTAFFVYNYLFLHQPVGDLIHYLSIGLVASAIFVGFSYTKYSVNLLFDFHSQFRGIINRWSAVVLIIFLMFFLLKVGADHSRGALLFFILFGLVALVCSRWVIARQLAAASARGTLAGTSAVIIGDSRSLAVLSRGDLLRRFGVSEIGRFELSCRDRSVEDPDPLVVIDDAIECARWAEQVLLALEWADERQRNLVCERLQVLPVSVLLLPDQQVSSLVSLSGRELGSDFAIELQRPPLSAQELAAKRVFDLLSAGATIVLLAPLLAVTSLLIKINSAGPVLFRQRRRGFNGREFTIYKFRTMHVLEDGDVIIQAQRNDKRATRVGRVLRATSIDELPQLINVIRGEMSLVGPRPHAVAHDDGFGKLIGNYAFRQHMKPGITGWAQVHGFRGETPQLELMQERITLDLWYIKHWSLWLDLRIAALTCFELIRRRDVY